MGQCFFIGATYSLCHISVHVLWILSCVAIKSCYCCRHKEKSRHNITRTSSKRISNHTMRYKTLESEILAKRRHGSEVGRGRNTVLAIREKNTFKTVLCKFCNSVIVCAVCKKVINFRSKTYGRYVKCQNTSTAVNALFMYINKRFNFPFIRLVVAYQQALCFRLACSSSSSWYPISGLRRSICFVSSSLSGLYRRIILVRETQSYLCTFASNVSPQSALVYFLSYPLCVHSSTSVEHHFDIRSHCYFIVVFTNVSLPNSARKEREKVLHKRTSEEPNEVCPTKFFSVYTNKSVRHYL